MRTRFRWLAVIILPLFVLRTADILFRVDPRTGFFTAQPGWLFFGISLGALALVVLVAMLGSRKNTETFAPSAPHPLGAISLTVVGVLVLAGSVDLLLNILRQPLEGVNGGAQAFELRFLFMRRADLFQVVRDLHFRMQFWCALAGILFIFWAFILMAWRIGHGRPGATVLFCLPAVWFGLRAVCDYAIAPVNPNNTIILSCLISDLLLALFYLRFARALSLGRQSAHIKWLAPHALAAAGFTLAFSLPLLLLSSGSAFSGLSVLYISSDAVAAVSALILADRCLKKASVHHEK